VCVHIDPWYYFVDCPKCGGAASFDRSKREVPILATCETGDCKTSFCTGCRECIGSEEMAYHDGTALEVETRRQLLKRAAGADADVEAAVEAEVKQWKVKPRDCRTPAHLQYCTELTLLGSLLPKLPSGLCLPPFLFFRHFFC